MRREGREEGGEREGGGRGRGKGERGGERGGKEMRFKPQAEAGALIEYGVNLLDLYFRSAAFIDKILKVSYLRIFRLSAPSSSISW